MKPNGVCGGDMSIKSKFFVSSIIMLVLPVFLMVLITAFILVLVAGYLPSVSVDFGRAAAFSANPVLQKYVLLWLFVLIAVVAACCAGVTAYLSRTILTPLRKMSDAMEHIANGDLDYEFTCSGDKEIKEVYDALDRLRISLKDSVSENIRHEKEYRRLIANISHDLKTPITSIKGYVEGIHDGVANTPEKLEKYLKTISQKAIVLEGLADSLSVYSRLDFENETYNHEKCELCSFVMNVLDDYSIDLHDADINLKIGEDLKSESVYVMLDKKKIRRVLVNVIGNAIKYKKPEAESELKVDLSRETNGAILSFADNGIGIKQEEERKVFEAFYRSDSARTPETSGSGLGLSIADMIVRDHGGRIWMRANEKSDGVTVYIFFPDKKSDK